MIRTLTVPLLALALSLATGAGAAAATPSTAPSSSPTGEAPPNRPLIVVRKLVILGSGHASKADLYGTVALRDRDDSSRRGTAFDEPSGDAVPLEFGDPAPLEANGLSARHVAIDVDLWDHWSPIFIPDTHLASGTIDADTLHDGINEITLGSARITLSKQQSWQQTTIHKVALEDSRYDHADLYGTMEIRVIYTDQDARRVVSFFTIFDRAAVDRVRVDRGANIWTGPLTVYTDTDQPAVLADLWDYYSWRPDEHLAVGAAKVPVTYEPSYHEHRQDIDGTGKVEVFATTSRSNENPDAGQVQSFWRTPSEDPAYWTPARMEDADQSDDSFGPLVGGGREASSTQRATNPRVGMLFYRLGGRDRICSAVSVPSQLGDQVETAAHCLLDAGSADRASNIVFVPGYDRSQPNPRPYGVWGYRVAEELQGWTRWRDRAEDQAIVPVYPQGGVNLAQRVGFERILFDQNPTQPQVRAQGYSVPPLNGGELYECHGATEGRRGRSYLSDCDLRAGSSGGPMLMCDPHVPSTVAVYAVVSGGNPSRRDLFGHPQSLLLRDLMMRVDH